MSRFLGILTCAVGFFFSTFSFAAKLGMVGHRWGIIFVQRSTDTPFLRNVGQYHDLLPLIYFEKDSFYIHGLDLGYEFYKFDTSSSLQLVSKYRFLDLPVEYRNGIDNGINMGLEYHRELNSYWDVYADILSDLEGRPLANLKTTFSLQTWNLYWNFYVDFNYKSTKYNKQYYGLKEKDVPADVDTNLGADLKVNVYENLYLTGGAELTYFGTKTIKEANLVKSTQTKYYLGGGLMDVRTREYELDSKYYQRYGFGFATTTTTKEIATKLKSKSDPYRNKLASFFYGIPLADEIFSIPIAAYFQPGIAVHLQNKDRQGNFPEYVAMIKLRYTIPLPIHLRVGFGEGISYSTEITDLEMRDMIESGLEPSKLLNFLDYSWEVSLHDIFRADIFKDMWFGWYLHHRSGIFGTSILFNKVSGGSNYNTLYFTYEY